MTFQQSRSIFDLLPDEAPQQPQKTIFDNLDNQPQEEFPYEGENDLEREIERNIARMTSRGIEQIVGLPGDLQSLATNITGHEFDPQNQYPTSQQLKDFSEKWSLGYTTPKTDYEKSGDELMETITQMSLPGLGKVNFWQTLGKPILSQLAKEGVVYAGGSEGKGEAAKLGTLLFSDLIMKRLNLGSAKKIGEGLFKEAQSLVPESALIDSNLLKKSLTDLIGKFKKGGLSPSVKPSIEKAEELRKMANKGNFSIQEAMEARKKINEIIEELKGFEIGKSKKIQQKTVRNMNDVKSKLIDAIHDYGARENPEFLKLDKQANEVWGAYENSNKVTNFIKKNFGDKFNSLTAKILLGLGTGGVSYMSPVAAGVSAVTLPGYFIFKGMNQLKNSPTLRKLYGGIIKDSIQGNSVAASKKIKAFDSKLQKEEEKDLR